MAHKKVTSPKIAKIASRALRSNTTSKKQKGLLEAHCHKLQANIAGKNSELILNASPKVLGPRPTALKTRGILV